MFGCWIFDIVYAQAMRCVPSRSLKVRDIVDVEGENWLPLLAGATNLVTLGVERSPGETAGILAAMGNLPSLRRFYRGGDNGKGNLFNLGKIKGAMRKQGGNIKFHAMPS